LEDSARAKARKRHKLAPLISTQRILLNFSKNFFKEKIQKTSKNFPILFEEKKAKILKNLYYE